MCRLGLREYHCHPASGSPGPRRGFNHKWLEQLPREMISPPDHAVLAKGREVKAARGYAHGLVPDLQRAGCVPALGKLDGQEDVGGVLRPLRGRADLRRLAVVAVQHSDEIVQAIFLSLHGLPHLRGDPHGLLLRAGMTSLHNLAHCIVPTSMHQPPNVRCLHSRQRQARALEALQNGSLGIQGPEFACPRSREDCAKPEQRTEPRRHPMATTAR
mmetsp:Transcript_32948/g.92986  ORF Transcript_32948/g.92986 Transcript_32948/m.92986 type:complete len:215 (+) Transcript_32948:790-1434(+)